MAYFISNKNVTIPCTQKNDKFNSLDQLYAQLIDHGWCKLSVFLPNNGIQITSVVDNAMLQF